MSTPSQTVGPFFALGLPGRNAAAEGVWLRGRVLDGAGEPVPDALIESWQADPPAFGRCATDPAGRWALRVPPFPHHVDLSVFARGLLNRVVTRLYLPDAPVDEVLASVDPARRGTLVAKATEDGYELDIHLQGPHETVFFAL
jgi:protocatechuate 3,4-dioxygenase, alpha subunit